MNLLEWFLVVFFVMPMCLAGLIAFIVLVYIICNVSISIKTDWKGGVK